MVLTTRAIGPVSVHPSSYQQTPQQLLDTVAGDKLVSLLRQIAQLSDYAAEIFNSHRAHHTVFARPTSAGCRSNVVAHSHRKPPSVCCMSACVLSRPVRGCEQQLLSRVVPVVARVLSVRSHSSAGQSVRRPPPLRLLQPILRSVLRASR